MRLGRRAPEDVAPVAGRAGACRHTYDVILVDEAQFFAPLSGLRLPLILNRLPATSSSWPTPRRAFKRRQSWLACWSGGTRGPHRLNKSYRTTREILNFATLLYRTAVRR